MPRVLLIGWDSADWNLIHPLLDRGEMPALASLVSGGTMGRLATVYPPEPVALWTSIATGRTADRHGILGPWEMDPQTGHVRPASGARAVKAVWDIANANGLRTHVVGWPGAPRAEAVDGVFVAPSFALSGAADSIHPASVAGPLRQLRMTASDIPPSALVEFLPRASRIDQRYDERLADIAAALAVCCTNHNAATWALSNEPWDFAAVYYHAIGEFSRRFMHFHPPRQDGIGDTDFEIYQDAIAAIYRFHDRMLARLIELAGPQARIMLVSDHGFESGARRPPPGSLAALKPQTWFTPFGVFCASGPGIRRDELIYGASLLDIAPTALALLGISEGIGTDGRVLADIFEEPPRHWPAVRPASVDSSSLRGFLEQFRLFEQFDPAQIHPTEANLAERLRFDLACVYLTSGRPAEALPILEALAGAAPEDLRFQRALAQAYLAAGRFDDAARLLKRLLGGCETLPWMHFLMGVVRMHRREFDAALDLFRQAQDSGETAPAIAAFIGNIFVHQKMWDAAEEAFGRALEGDPGSVDAHVGMAAVRLHQRRAEEAAEHALRAVSIRYDHPLAHYQLGLALERLGQYARAATALEAGLALAPDMEQVRRHLHQVRARAAAVPKAHG